VLTRQNRRLRWAIRCVLHKKPATHVHTGEHGELRGECPGCRHRTLVASAWIRAFGMRQALVRRNLPRGELRESLLKWVWDTEQARGDKTWRRQPNPPRPPNGGGTPLRLPAHGQAAA
jgi:hypothetical protein